MIPATSFSLRWFFGESTSHRLTRNIQWLQSSWKCAIPDPENFLSISLNIFQIFYIDFVKLFLCTFSVLRVKPKKSNIVFTFLWKCIAVICGERNILRLWSIYSKKKLSRKILNWSLCVLKKKQEKKCENINIIKYSSFHGE